MSATRSSSTFLLGLSLATAAWACDWCGCQDLGGSGGGPITTQSARTLAQGAASLSLRADLTEFVSRSDEELANFAVNDIDAHSEDSFLAVSLSAAYGLTKDLTVGAQIPYNENEDVRNPFVDPGTGAPGVITLGDSAGLGDLIVFGQWRFFRAEDAQVDLAATVGLKTPTGQTEVRTRQGDKFEVHHQPGTGAWDPILGLAISKSWERFSLHASVNHTFTTEGSQRTTLGDVTGYGVAGVYRVVAASGGEPGLTCDAILELNGQHAEQQEVAGRRDVNTGGDVLFISPGVRIGIGAHWSFFGEVGVPIWQDVNGKEHVTDYRVSFGIGVGF